MASCAYGIDYFDTNYSKLVSEAMSCACNHGADYLQCYMNMIPKSCSSALLGGYGRPSPCDCERTIELEHVLTRPSSKSLISS